MLKFTDSAVVAGTRRREDGALIVDARIARTGIQLYRGSEVGRPDMAMVRIYRPGAEVFAEDAMKSAAHRPITNDHPPEMVDSTNWKKYSVGQTGDEVTGEGIFIRVPLMVSDENTIKDIESGKRELSPGYTCKLDWTAGKTPAGDEYDASQREIRINHVAIVQAARGGSEVRIGDDATSWGASPVITTPAERKGAQPMADITLRTVLVDGLSVSVTDQGAQAIDKLIKERDEARKATADAAKAHETVVATLNADHAKALAAKDADLAKKDAEIDGLKGKVLDGAALDKLVASRANLITLAKAIAKDVKVEGLSDADIKKAAVTAALGDAAVKDKPQAYIDARFDILAEDAAKKAGNGGTDAVRDAILNGGGAAHAAVDDAAVSNAYAEMVKQMTSAHQPAKAN